LGVEEHEVKLLAEEPKDRTHVLDAKSDQNSETSSRDFQNFVEEEYLLSNHLQLSLSL